MASEHFQTTLLRWPDEFRIINQNLSDRREFFERRLIPAIVYEYTNLF